MGADIHTCTGRARWTLQEAQWPPHTQHSYANISARIAAWSDYEIACSAPHYTREGPYRSNRCVLQSRGCPTEEASLGAGSIAVIVAAAVAAAAAVAFAVVTVRGRRWFREQRSDVPAAYAAEVAARRPKRLTGLPSILGPHAPPMWGAAGTDWDDADGQGEGEGVGRSRGTAAWAMWPPARVRPALEPSVAAERHRALLLLPSSSPAPSAPPSRGHDGAQPPPPPAHSPLDEDPYAFP